jgi:hypothetical protein
MDENLLIVYVIGIGVLMLNIILFFKIWGMTNNVKHILSYILIKDGYKMKEELDGPMSFVKIEDDKQSPDELAALESLGKAAFNKE